MKGINVSLAGPVVFLVLLSWMSPQAMAQSVVMNIAQDPAKVNHYPGPDGLTGNGDDVVSDALTTVQSSAPNAVGSFGHNAFLFQPFGPQDPNLPVGFDAITFVDGTVTVDAGVMASGGGPIISALDITSGTEPFPGHGAYTSTVTAVNSGTYDPETGAFTLNVDISYTIFGAPSTEPGVVLTGTAIYRRAADYGTPTGNAYFDNVAVPMAQAAAARAVVFLTGTGTLTNLGFPINASLIALDPGPFVINAGLNDAWVSEGAAKQGFFFTVFEDLGLLFLSWFTFDSVPPDQDVIAVFGAADHRWVTGIDEYTGNSVTIEVELTSGGLFNTSVPLAGQEQGYGTITIVFNHCNEAILTYNFPNLGLSGQMTLTRVLSDNVALCQLLSIP